jgi:hypothetical protein
MLVKFSSLAGGVFIEVTDKMEYESSDRCFRFDAKGNAEYAFYGDLVANGERARYYGHVYKANEFLIA